MTTDDRFTAGDLDAIAARVRELHAAATQAESDGEIALAEDLRAEADDLAELAADDIAGA